MKIKELTKSFEYFKNKSMINKKCTFACFDENMISYHIKDINGGFYELTFICEDTMLLKMTVKDLLNLKRITYFDINYYKESGDVIRIGLYSSMDKSILN